MRSAANPLPTIQRSLMERWSHGALNWELALSGKLSFTPCERKTCDISRTHWAGRIRFERKASDLMPDDNGKLTSADIPIINDFITRASPDNCLSCPVTGDRIPASEWMISDRLCMLPTSGVYFKADLVNSAPVLSCRSPAGGVVFLDALNMGLLKRGTQH